MTDTGRSKWLDWQPDDASSFVSSVSASEGGKKGSDPLRGALTELTKPSEGNIGPVSFVSSVSDHKRGQKLLDPLNQPLTELTKPSEVSSVSFVSDSLETEVCELFVSWVDANFTLNPRGSTGLVWMHLAFCERCVKKNMAALTRAMFEGLLREVGFVITEVCGTQLVPGLILKADLKAAEKD